MATSRFRQALETAPNAGIGSDRELRAFLQHQCDSFSSGSSSDLRDDIVKRVGPQHARTLDYIGPDRGAPHVLRMPTQSNGDPVRAREGSNEARQNAAFFASDLRSRVALLQKLRQNAAAATTPTTAPAAAAAAAAAASDTKPRTTATSVSRVAAAAPWQASVNQIPTQQTCVVASRMDRAMSTRFEPTNGSHVAVAFSSGLSCYDVNAALELQRERQSGDISASTRQVVPRSGDVEIGWSLLDVSWLRRGASDPVAVASCWAPALIMHKIASREEVVLNIGEHGSGTGSFCCFAVDALSDNHVVVGTNDQYALVIDVARNVAVFETNEFMADVNAVCAAGPSNFVFVAGGDDAMARVFDTRISERSGSQMLLGHTNGLVSLSARGDDFHIVSSSKDQAIKVWDLRRVSKVPDHYMMSVIASNVKAISRFDYRLGPHTGAPARRATKFDSSLRTFYGHECFTTLCRARFSPLESTGGRYIISGSHAQSFAVFDLLSESMHPPLAVAGDHENIVRDVTWHPQRPLVATANWDGKLRFFSPWSARPLDDSGEAENRRFSTHDCE